MENQLIAPEKQGVYSVCPGWCQRGDRAVYMSLPVEVMVVLGLTGVKEAYALGVLLRGRPGVALVLITFAATPVQIVVNVDQIGAGMRAVLGAVVVYLAPRFPAQVKLVRQAISTTVTKIFPE
jgi:hypothetical protein